MELIGLFIALAVVLVAFGGRLAAADAALGTLSRNDLVELAANSRFTKSLLGISTDIGAHVTAINFVRVLSETTAAVLVTLMFALVLTDWWWVLLASVIARSAACHWSSSMVRGRKRWIAVPSGVTPPPIISAIEPVTTTAGRAGSSVPQARFMLPSVPSRPSSSSPRPVTTIGSSCGGRASV